MIFGFTGTQAGMTEAQKRVLSEIFYQHQDSEFHHGDCIGADAQAHDLAEAHELFIVVHPPINGTKRAHRRGQIVKPPLPYLARNREIIWACERLLAAPREHEEQPNGGTWYTVRFARRARVDCTIILPDGKLVFEENNAR